MATAYNEAWTPYLMSEPDIAEMPTLEDLLARPPWMGFANCRGKPTAMFFRGRGESSSPEAKRLCGGCQVRRECLDYALGFDWWALSGVWGGTTQRQRRAMRREAG